MSKSQLEHIKLYVAQLMNDEQNSHAKLIAELNLRIGGLKECKDLIDILERILKGKIEVLEKVYKEL